MATGLNDKNRCKNIFFWKHTCFFWKTNPFFLDSYIFSSYICNPKHKKKHCTMEKFMDKLTEAIIKNDGLSETEAKAKLNLIYIKMGQSEIKQFVDEFIDWLMTEKKLNYKAILQTPDTQLHDMFVAEFMH